MNQNKAVFLDRDGILNKEIGNYVTCLEDFEILEDKTPFFLEWKAQGYLFFIITNQGGIDKGMYSHEDLARIHDRLINYYIAHGITFSEIYYCPHHPTVTQCLCRKPNSLMIEKAIFKYNLNASMCFMIGDKERDTEAAENVGVKGYLIESNAGFDTIPW